MPPIVPKLTFGLSRDTEDLSKLLVLFGLSVYGKYREIQKSKDVEGWSWKSLYCTAQRGYTVSLRLYVPGRSLSEFLLDDWKDCVGSVVSSLMLTTITKL